MEIKQANDWLLIYDVDIKYPDNVCVCKLVWMNWFCI